MAQKAAVQRRRKPTTEQAAYFLSLTLKNVRCFGEREQVLDLSDGNGRPARWTILLGDNGTGKTTLLQALGSFSAFSVLSELPQLQQALVPVSRSLLERQLLRISASRATLATEVTVAAGLSSAADDPPFRSRIDLDMGRIRWNPLGPVPVAYGYGAARRLGGSVLGESERDDPAGSLFSDAIELRNAEEWLLQLDYSASKRSPIKDQQRQTLARVKDLLIELLPDVSDIRFTEPTKARRTPTVEFNTPFGWVPLRQIGYGYRTLLAWMVDFASRMVDRYPDSANPLAEPAVVLVDEIDLHLHPRWQRELIGYLTARFPNTQFIATAHSPLVVQAAGDANIAVLRREGDHVVIDNEPETIRGWRIDQILTSDLFGLESARPPELDGLLSERKKLLTKSRLTKADKEKLAQLDKQIGHLPAGETAEHAKTLDVIQQSIDFLKKHGNETS